MIRIRRSEPAPPKLVTDGRAELRASTRHYALALSTREPKYLPSSYFKAYQTSGVKEALNRLFHCKCAYCETRAQPSGYFAIEHFRPKASIKIGGKLKPPGYWWLAAEWDNLLPSCNRCNTSHKGNLFPIKGNQARKPEDSLAAEKRLLIDPCSDWPEKHLRFSSDGSVVGTSEKGRASIEVLGLDRLELTQDRRTWFRRAVKLQEEKARDLIVSHHGGNATDGALANEIRSLMSLRDEAEEYAGATRQITAKTVFDIATYLQDLGETIDSFVEAHATPEIPVMTTEEASDALDALLGSMQ